MTLDSLSPEQAELDISQGINYHNLTTRPNEYNPRGVKFDSLISCPLAPSEIDSRFFDLSGNPTAELKMRYRSIRKSAEGVLKDSDASFFVVGGVAAAFDKSGYDGDLDILVSSSTVSVEKQVPVAQNTAWLIASHAGINEGIDLGAKETAKSGEYTDVILSCGLPYEFWAVARGEVKYLYDLKKEKWLACWAI